MAKKKKRFFNKDNAVDTSIAPSGPACKTCRLWEVNELVKARTIGKGEKGVLVIGGNVFADENLKGELGHGKEFKLLEKLYEDATGGELLEDCFYTTAIGCHTPRNRNPSTTEMSCCKFRLDKAIETLPIKGLLLLGETPFKAVMGPKLAGRMNGLDHTDFYGECVPDQESKLHIMTTWSMTELLSVKTYDDSNYVSKALYLRDNAICSLVKKSMREILIASQETVKHIDYESLCKVTEDMDEALDMIDEAFSWDHISFDYETNALKPHKEGYIYCASISNGKVAYAFPMFRNEGFLKMWKRLMTCPIGKVAHQNQFEATWTKVRAGGYWVKPWAWDTCIGQHCYRNNKPASLKYATFVNYGICGYDSYADEYIVPSTADSKLYGGYALNRIHESDIKKTLLYNAEDSLFTSWLYRDQRRMLTEFQIEGVNLLVETATTLAKVSDNGITVNEAAFESVEIKLKELLETKEAEILAFEEAQKWDGEEVFNFNSSTQLGHLLFDILGKKPVKYTGTIDKNGKKTPSLDKEALEKMNMPFLNRILEYRDTAKMCSTYVEGWKRETADGIVHSSFNLATVDTFRGSSNLPNVQTAYKRDEAKKKIVRSLVRASKGNRLVEYDEKGLEVYINLFHSKDPMFRKYLLDPSTDMHADMTCVAFMLKPEEMKKSWRGAVKGLLVFALLYGSYYGLIAKDLWDFAHGEPELLAHMKAKGVVSYKQFEDQIKKAEENFWGVRFITHDVWRKDQFKMYQANGYLESYTGFRLQTPMSRNNSFNGKVQGDGAHVLFWVMNKVQAKIEELGLKSKIINTIHDSIVFDMVPEEERVIDYWLAIYNTVEVRKMYPWITMDLQMEKERSEIDGNWSEMTGCGFISCKEGLNNA